MRPQQTIVERLDFVAKRIPGLKFTPPTQQPGDEQFYDCFMSCDMYYIEIKVDQSHQSVKDVIISHSNSPAEISCPVLRKVLAEQDFETFAKHLSGLHSIYQINTNDKKVKQRAYPALTALENDLSTLYEHQSDRFYIRQTYCGTIFRRRIPSCHDLVHKSPIGVMEPRRGGLPVKLTYFITPYDLVDASQKSFINLTVDNIVEKNLGLSATVEIEGSSPHKIQIKSLITQNNQSNLPLYAPFNGQNSEKLPAQFVLKLSQPLPMLNTSISQIITEINEPSTTKEHLSNLMTSSKDSIISLIARQELDLNKGLFGRTTTSVETLKGVDAEMYDLKRQVYSIKLTDQHHTYHIIDNYLERPEGVYIEKIPFTHPTSIPSILKVLRQQALFNFVIGSCIRRNRSSNGASSNAGSASTDENNATKLAQQVSNIFDVLPVSLTNVCISFEHPSRESLATVEIDFKDIVCRLYALDKESVCSDEFATKTLQKCWSIPVTLRSVLRKCNETRLALLEDSNKRRERELQELLATNPSTNHLQPSAINLTQETLLQSRLSNNNVPATTDKAANPRDLNSIAEFLSNKVNSLSSAATERINQAASVANSDNNRTNLLKKFSCKPKVKQTSTTTKSQTGNKILSLMLKRQSSTGSGSNEDPISKGPLVKKAKTKNVAVESTSAFVDGPPPPVLTTTKLISPDVALAARLASIKQQQQQQTKQSAGNSASKDTSISLIKAPKPPLSQTVSSVNMALSSNASNNNQAVNNIRLKSQMINGSSGSSAASKSRKSSIGAVLDRLVGNVTPEQQGNLISQLTSSLDSNQESLKGAADSSKLNLNGGPKKNSKPPGGDQFAIKQGGSGGGLKLTVTKTKPSVTVPTSSTPSTTQQLTASAPPTSASASSTSTSAANSSSTTSSNSSTITTSTSNKQSDASKILELGSVAPSIRYTIPKISKTQTAPHVGPSNQNSSDIIPSSQNDSSAAQTGDDSANPSPSVSQSSTPSSTTIASLNKRTTSNPFNRNIVINRNSVSSSTHPPNRTTSNPLANASSNRPSSTTTSNNNGDSSNHTSNRMNSGSNQNLQQRQSIMNRSVNLLPQPHFASPSSSSLPSASNPPSVSVVPSRLLNPSSTLLAQQQAAAQLIRQQPALSQLFSLRLPQQTTQNIFSSVNDLNLIASQVALLNQQQQLQQQQAQQLQLQQQVQQHIQQQQFFQSQTTPASMHQQLPTGPLQSRVTSSSDSQADDPAPQIVQSNLPSSTPSSPTECGTTETVVPPPLIPIDSLEEAHQGSDVDHDDESDRLSIVDMNEHAASDSTAGTPRPSGAGSPMTGVQESLSIMGSPSVFGGQRTVDSTDSSSDVISCVSRPKVQPLSIESAEEASSKPESSTLSSGPLDIRVKDQNSTADASSDAMDITQSPQSSTTPSTAATSNLA